jgi:hypothetical protein
MNLKVKEKPVTHSEVERIKAVYASYKKETASFEK